MENSRDGAKQPERFDPGRAAQLDDPARFDYLPPAELFALLDAPKGGVVVDFGAGTGAYAIKLAQARPDLDILALDEQPQMLELLKKKLSLNPAPNIRPILADGKSLDALQGGADRILAVNVLHEVGDTPLRQMADLLNPQGNILFVDWNGAIERPVGPPRDHVLTPDEAARRVRVLGMEVLTSRSFRYHYALVCGLRRMD